jgi:hypothetical protein
MSAMINLPDENGDSNFNRQNHLINGISIQRLNFVWNNSFFPAMALGF